MLATHASLVRALTLSATLLLAASKPIHAQCTPTSPSPTPLSGPFGFGGVNGNKVVSASVLHRVHEDGNRIYHSSSIDGFSWSLPSQIGFTTGPGMISPTIAVASGMVGVAFVRSPSGSGQEGDVYYTFRSSNGLWSTPQHITWGGSPAMEGLGADMHLVTTGGKSGYYLRFPVNQPPSSATAGETVGVLPLCAVGQTSFPAIAVAQADVCNIEPVLVRVAFFRFHDCTACWSQDPYRYDVQLWERDGAPLDPWGTLRYSQSLWLGTSPPNVGAMSLSLDANRTTGVCVLAYSYVGSSANSTRLVRVTRAGVATAHEMNTNRTIIDVNVRDVFCTDGIQLRFARSDWVSGQSHYPTVVSTGLWMNGSNVPVWGPVDTVSATAREAQAIFWTRYIGGVLNNVRAVYEIQSGSTYGITTDHAHCPAFPHPLSLAGLTCSNPCWKRMAVLYVPRFNL